MCTVQSLHNKGYLSGGGGGGGTLMKIAVAGGDDEEKQSHKEKILIADASATFFATQMHAFESCRKDPGPRTLREDLPTSR